MEKGDDRLGRATDSVQWERERLGVPYTHTMAGLAPMASGVDEPERSWTPFRYLLFSRNARSGTYFQIS